MTALQVQLIADARPVHASPVRKQIMWQQRCRTSTAVQYARPCSVILTGPELRGSPAWTGCRGVAAVTGCCERYSHLDGPADGGVEVHEHSPLQLLHAAPLALGALCSLARPLTRGGRMCMALDAVTCHVSCSCRVSHSPAGKSEGRHRVDTNEAKPALCRTTRAHFIHLSGLTSCL